MSVLRQLLLIVVPAIAAGCASHAPAPVEERGGTPPARAAGAAAPPAAAARERGGERDLGALKNMFDD